MGTALVTRVVPMATQFEFNLKDLGGGSFQEATRYFAAVVVMIWMGYILFNNLAPSRRGGGMGRRIGGGKIFLLIVTLACLIDLSLFDSIGNFVMSMVSVAGEKIGEMLGKINITPGVSGGTPVTTP